MHVKTSSYACKDPKLWWEKSKQYLVYKSVKIPTEV